MKLEEALKKVRYERDTTGLTRAEKDILKAKYDKFLDEVKLLPKLKAIKKSLWDQTRFFPIYLIRWSIT